MLATIRTAIRRASTNRRIASADYVKAHISTIGTQMWLNTSTYGNVTWSTGRGCQSGVARTGVGPVEGTRLPVEHDGMSASDECEAAALESANAALTAAGWKSAKPWDKYWDDANLDSWEVRIVRA